MAMNRRNQLAQMPHGDVVCRVLNGHHTPNGEPEVFNAPGGGYEMVFTCIYCGTEISKFRDRHGFLTGRRKYTPRSTEDGGTPYVMQEGGKLTKEEKARLFLREAQVGRKVTQIKGRRGRKAS